MSLSYTNAWETEEVLEEQRNNKKQIFMNAPRSHKLAFLFPTNMYFILRAHNQREKVRMCEQAFKCKWYN